MGINQEIHYKSSGVTKNIFYNELYQNTIKSSYSFENSNKKNCESGFSGYQYAQKNIYKNSHINYETHYETYYTYEKHRIKSLKEKGFSTPKGGTCSTKFLGISTIVLIIILLSSFSHFNMNKKSKKKHSQFQEPLSRQSLY
ncbi:hypothetical protein PMAC_003081 [Pneumocystis sp. 'macacae']|nr:hypothetical protein PMAC_003081 [Pneumocystis sp. 'macacae']